MVRRAVLLLTTMAVGVLLAGGAALAANVIACPGGLCEGTTGDDEMTGTSATDYLYAKEGNDTLRGLGAFDDLRGGPGNDDLNGGGGNDQYNIYDNNWGADRISGDSAGQCPGALFGPLIPRRSNDEDDSVDGRGPRAGSLWREASRDPGCRHERGRCSGPGPDDA